MLFIIKDKKLNQPLMKLTILLLKYVLILQLFIFGYPIYAKVPLKIEKLQVEYMTNPKGLDRAKPRFNWIFQNMKDVFGQTQKGYRIIVSDNLATLSKGVGNLWDTGWQHSSQMNQITYAGNNLQSDRTYYWKVKVKDQYGKESAWSTVAQWSTGITDPKQWKGEWIGGSTLFDKNAVDCNIPDPWFRKTITLSHKPGKATFFMASIGYHELYVNGKRVGEEVLAPTVTDHTKRARYVAYDIASYLQKGKNVIAVWLGTSWSIFPGYDLNGTRPLTPLFNGQMDCYDHINPTAQESAFYHLVTDTTWRYKDSPNKLIGNWNFGQMGGEIWDDRKHEGDWNQLNYSDRDWNQATSYPLGIKISASNSEGNKIVQTIVPISIESQPNNQYRVDMGVNFAGWTSIKVHGNPGDTVKLYFSEREQEKMTFNIHSAVVVGNSGEATFQNRFNYSSGRWITIVGATRKPSLTDIKGWLVRTAYEGATSFECSVSLQNWLHRTIKWNFENLSLGGFIVDCPQRERMGYGGDAHATSETGMMNYHLGAFYTKWMEDWRDVQGTEPMVGNMRDSNYARKEMTSGRIFNNGVLPHTAPTYWGGGGPSWGGIVVSLPYFMYEQYGDIQVLSDNYSLIKNWLSFLDSHVKDNLLMRFGGQWDFLGDWLWPNATAEGMNNDKPETLCLNNSYRIFNLRTAAKIATILGDQVKAAQWTQQADISSKTLHQKFYQPDKHVYADGSMANMAAALLAEVVPADEKQAVIKSLEDEILIHRKGHIHAGITGGALLFKYLRETGRNDLIYTMTSQKTYPSWGYMKDNGATSIWEMWEKDLPGHSLLHSSYLYPGAWMIDGLGGIKRLTPGYSQFVIQPPLKEETSLTWAKTNFESPCGLIRSDWQRTDGRLRLNVMVPPNTICILKIAKDESHEIPEEFYVQYDPKDSFYNFYQLPSGEYQF